MGGRAVRPGGPAVGGGRFLRQAAWAIAAAQRRPDLLGAVAAFSVGVVPRQISGACRAARVRHDLAAGTHYEPGFGRSTRERAERLRRAGLPCGHGEWTGGHDQLRWQQLPVARAATGLTCDDHGPDGHDRRDDCEHGERDHGRRLRLREAAIMPAFTSPAVHASPLTAVLKGIRRRARTGGRRGSALISSAGMSAVIAAAPRRCAARGPGRSASKSSLSSRPCTNAALSRSITAGGRHARPAGPPLPPGLPVLVSPAPPTCMHGVIRSASGGRAPRQGSYP